MMRKNVKTQSRALRARLKRPLGNSSGMTMVEVLVAFAVLMLVLALSNTAVQTALNLSNMAEDVRHRTETALAGYYGAERTADETACAFDDFDLPVYPGVYTNPDTGYSFYWFNDGQDHTPPEEPEEPEEPGGGEMPKWFPNGSFPVLSASWWLYGDWDTWWSYVPASCKAEWRELLENTPSWRGRVNSYVSLTAALCPP